MNGAIIPSGKGDWVTVVDDTSHLLKYMVVSGIVYVAMAVKSGGTISASWSSVGTLPIKPSDNLYQCAYADASARITYTIQTDGTVQVAGNTKVPCMMSFPLT